MRLALPAAVLTLLLGCDRRPDVVLITIDTLRVDHVGAFAPDSPARTPHMDRLAAAGVRYTQAYSPISVTGPAFCTLHTGKLPSRHGVVMNVFRGGANLPPAAETLAERLSAAGWSTGAYLSGFTLRPSLGLDQGFDSYVAPGARRRSGGNTNDRLWGWLVRQPGPVLAWYHSYDPHGPLGAWDEPAVHAGLRRGGPELERIPQYQRIDDITDEAFFRARYAHAVEYADAQVGRILWMLEATGRYDDALIVLTADHGESFTERELWFDHGTTAHEEQLHVPLVIKYPDGWGAGRAEDALVGLQDVAPTVLDALGLPGLLVTDGMSLRVEPLVGHPQLEGESSHCKKEPVLGCAPRGPGGKMLAVRTRDQTYIEEPRSEGPSARLYDRSADPGERAPLAQPAPAALHAVVARMAADRAAMGLVDPEADEAPAGGRAQADDELEALRALGYISGPATEPPAPAGAP
jgi:arylsulfatase A-like enzyme